MSILGTHTKQPAETYVIYVDFVRRLQAGETLSSRSATSKNLATGADSSAALITSHAINGTKVEARLKAGQTTGEDHRVTFQTTTNLGNVYEDEVDVAIRED